MLVMFPAQAWFGAVSARSLTRFAKPGRAWRLSVVRGLRGSGSSSRFFAASTAKNRSRPIRAPAAFRCGPHQMLHQVRVDLPPLPLAMSLVVVLPAHADPDASAPDRKPHGLASAFLPSTSDRANPLFF